MTKTAYVIVPHAEVPDAEVVQSISGSQSDNWACNDFIHHVIRDGDQSNDFIVKESCKFCYKFQMDNEWSECRKLIRKYLVEAN